MSSLAISTETVKEVPKLAKIGKLGNGAYGTVYSAKFPNSPKSPETSCLSPNLAVDISLEYEPYAVKRNFADKSSTGVGNVRELDNMVQLNGHPLIINLRHVSFCDPFTEIKPMTPIKNLESRVALKDDKIHFVMEYAPISGISYIMDRKQCTSYNLKIMMCQLLLGTEIMHAKGITHRDIKPDNILLNFDDRKLPILKICDFGFSKVQCIAMPSTPGAVTSWYRAPEICIANPYYDSKIDMWSIGCTFFEFLSRVPFLYNIQDNSHSAYLGIYERLPVVPSLLAISKMRTKAKDPINISYSRSLQRRSFRDQINLSQAEIDNFNLTSGSYDEFLDLLDKLICFDPDERYDCERALSHPFFSFIKPYIDQMRKIYPPVSPSKPITKITKCRERTWAMEIAFGLYNNQRNYVWYKDGIIFHAIELFDRYIKWMFSKNNTKIHLRELETLELGRIHTREETELRFYTCIYLMHKYYSTVCCPLQWNKIAPESLTSEINEAKFEEFEKFLLKDVLEYKIFQETLLELIQSDDYIANVETIHVLLKGYGFMEEYEGSIIKLFDKIILDDSKKAKLPQAPSVLVTGARATSAEKVIGDNGYRKTVISPYPC